MSGGIAYVYDPDGQLKGQCNLDSVELESIAPAGTSWATARLRPRPSASATTAWATRCARRRAAAASSLERHRRRPDSRRAAELLADWPNALQHFVKVMPIEYRRALADLESVAVAAE